MAVAPVPGNWASGDFLIPEKFNKEIRDPLKWLISERPLASVCRKNSTQSMASGAEVTFDTVLIDSTDDMIDLGTNATRITINTDGFYLLNMSFPWTDDATGNFRTFRINKNGSEISGDVRLKYSSAGGQLAMSQTTFAYLVAGDYLEIEIVHDATAFVSRTANDGPKLNAMWLSS